MGMRYKAILVGGGRIATGIGGFSYSHLKAYSELKDRVEVVGIVDTNPDVCAKLRESGHRVFSSLESCDIPYDIVSICTPPHVRASIFHRLLSVPDLKGVWCEKPYGLERKGWPWPVQVNYTRRFDPLHQQIYLQRKKGELGGAELFVIAKADEHTVCHFTDLARWWNIGRDGLYYFPHNGPCSYFLRRYNSPGPQDTFFPLGGMADVQFSMNEALGNLLDAVEGKARLISPVEEAVESERWADEVLALLKEAGNGSGI